MINEQALLDHNEQKEIVVEQMVEYFIEAIEENGGVEKAEKFDRLRMVEEQEQKHLKTINEEEEKIDLVFNEQALKYISEVNAVSSQLTKAIEELAELETESPALQESTKSTTFNFSL